MPCQTCSHPQRQAIDQALLAENHTFPALSQTYGLSVSSLFRHKKHLVEKMRQARQRLRDSQQQVSLLKLNAYLDHVQRAVQTAKTEGNINLVLKGAQVGSWIIRQISQMDVPLELDTVYRLISSPKFVSQDSLLPNDPQIIIAIHQSLADAAFFPCPDEEPKIHPEHEREKSGKLPKNLTLPSENISQNQSDSLCKKIPPKNPVPVAESAATRPSLSTHTKVHSNGGTGFQPVRTQSNGCSWLNSSLIATQYLVPERENPDSAPEIPPKNQREKSAKLPKNLTLPSENISQNQSDGLCEKIPPKNPMPSPQPSIIPNPRSPVPRPPSPVPNPRSPVSGPPSTDLPCIVPLKTDRYCRRGIF